jgi:hypothetical protein
MRSFFLFVALLCGALGCHPGSFEYGATEPEEHPDCEAVRQCITGLEPIYFECKDTCLSALELPSPACESYECIAVCLEPPYRVQLECYARYPDCNRCGWPSDEYMTCRHAASASFVDCFENCHDPDDALNCWSAFHADEDACPDQPEDAECPEN